MTMDIRFHNIRNIAKSNS